MTNNERKVHIKTCIYCALRAAEENLEQAFDRNQTDEAGFFTDNEELELRMLRNKVVDFKNKMMNSVKERL